MILIFAAATAAAPSPSPAPADVCGGARTNVLATLDRPSIGYSPCAVKRGESLFEMGYSNTSGTGGSVAAYPQGFFRFGTGRGLELDAIAGGRSDSGLGAKYEFWHDGSRALAADFLYTAPTGIASLTAGAPTQALNLDYTFPLSSVFSISSTIGAQSSYASALRGTSSRFVSVLPSVVLADQWNPRAQAFVEGFAQTRTRPDGGALFGIDAAVQYLLAPQFEIDLEAGRTITDVNRSHFAGFGFGARF